jgi:hypothetical protein
MEQGRSQKWHSLSPAQAETMLAAFASVGAKVGADGVLPSVGAKVGAAGVLPLVCFFTAGCDSSNGSSSLGSLYTLRCVRPLRLSPSSLTGSEALVTSPADFAAFFAGMFLFYSAFVLALSFELSAASTPTRPIFHSY